MTLRVHELKSWPETFQPVLDGQKTHEVRKNDRGFRVGDVLWLREWLPEKQAYTGRVTFAEVMYITDAGSWGLPEDVCVMSVKIGSVVSSAPQVNAPFASRATA